MKDKTYREGVIIAIIACLFYGFGGITAKYCKADGTGTFSVTLLRNLMSLPVLFVFCKAKGYSLKVDKSQFAFLFVGGILVSCVTPVLLYASYDYISVGLTYCIHYVYPVVIALTNFLIFKEKMSRQKIVAMAFALVGIWVILFSASTVNLLGIIFAFLSSIGYSAYVIFIAKTGIRQLPGPVCAFWCTASSIVALLALCLCTGEAFVCPSGKTFFWIFITGLFVVCLGNGLIPEAVKRAGSSTVSILGILEPITTVVVSILFMKEAITARSLIGAIFVLTSAILVLTEKEKPKAETSVPEA